MMKNRDYSNRIVKNTIWDFIGQLLPLIVGIVTIPMLIREMGLELFGLLSIAWMLIGYMSLFDFGVAKALTKYISTLKTNPNNTDEIKRVIKTGIWLLMCTGLLGSFTLLMLSEWLSNSVLNSTEETVEISQRTFIYISLTIPLVIVTAGIRGILYSYGLFKPVNIIRIPQGILTFLLPLIIFQIWEDFPLAIVGLILIRLLSTIAHVVAFKIYIPEFNLLGQLHYQTSKKLLGFGGWITVSNIVGPFLSYFDRLVIGAVISVSAVSYYVTPYEIITRTRIFPNAIINVLFPAFSELIVESPEKLRILVSRYLKTMLIVLFPLTMIFILFSKAILTVWIDSEFSQQSYRVLQILSIGVYISGFAQIFVNVLYASGKPDWPAKVHLVELPLYIIAMYFAATNFGIIGVASIWVIRVLIDTVLFLFLYARLMRNVHIHVKQTLIYLTISCIMFALLMTSDDLQKSIFLAVTTFIIFIFIVWRWIIENSERRRLASLLAEKLKHR